MRRGHSGKLSTTNGWLVKLHFTIIIVIVIFFFCSITVIIVISLLLLLLFWKFTYLT